MECITRGGKAKKKYENEETAKEKALLMEKRYKEPFNYYQCEYCGFFHVGRQNGVKRMNETEKRQLEQHRRNMENPLYPGIRTKKDLKNKVIMGNTERILKEEVE